jgi:transcriptional regulator with XRE-family HTH domain
MNLGTLWSNAGLNKNVTVNMKKSMPKADSLAKIADVLDVSVDYLLGRSDVPNPEKQIKNVLKMDEEQSLDPVLCDFILELAQAPSEVQQSIISIGEKVLRINNSNKQA